MEFGTPLWYRDKCQLWSWWVYPKIQNSMMQSLELPFLSACGAMLGYITKRCHLGRVRSWEKEAPFSSQFVSLFSSFQPSLDKLLCHFSAPQLKIYPPPKKHTISGFIQQTQLSVCQLPPDRKEKQSQIMWWGIASACVKMPFLPRWWIKLRLKKKAINDDLSLPEQ